MATRYTQEATTINRDIVSPFLHDETEKLNIPKPFQQNVKTFSGFGTTVAVIFGTAIFLLGESGTPNIPRPPLKNTSASVQWHFDEEIKSGVTQEFADTRQQRLAFPTYDEEDILDWDAVVVPPPPRRSGTIRVKLIYKGRSKPIPDDDPWE